MDLVCVRDYLRLPARATAEEVMRDALCNDDPGALAIVNIVLQLRLNPRTRRSLGEAKEVMNTGRVPRWYRIAQEHVWSTYRMFLAKALFSSNALACSQSCNLMSGCVSFGENWSHDVV